MHSRNKQTNNSKTYINVFSRAVISILLMCNNFPSPSLLVWDCKCIGRDSILPVMYLWLLCTIGTCIVSNREPDINICGNLIWPSSWVTSSVPSMFIGWVITKCSEYLCRRVRMSPVVIVQTRSNTELVMSSLAQAFGVTGGYLLRLWRCDVTNFFVSVDSSCLKQSLG